jgi:predicted nucleic acid-binding protein
VSIFVDSSALYALVDQADGQHEDATTLFRAMHGQRPVTHAHVVVEAASLTARRLPPEGTRLLFDGLLPAIDVTPVDASLHGEAVAAYRAAGSRGVSLVDRTSSGSMRRHAITTAFAFDADFRAAGFDLAQSADDDRGLCLVGAAPVTRQRRR